MAVSKGELGRERVRENEQPLGGKLGAQPKSQKHLLAQIKS